MKIRQRSKDIVERFNWASLRTERPGLMFFVGATKNSPECYIGNVVSKRPVGFCILPYTLYKHAIKKKISIYLLVLALSEFKKGQSVSNHNVPV